MNLLGETLSAGEREREWHDVRYQPIRWNLPYHHQRSINTNMLCLFVCFLYVRMCDKPRIRFISFRYASIVMAASTTAPTDRSNGFISDISMRSDISSGFSHGAHCRRVTTDETDDSVLSSAVQSTAEKLEKLRALMSQTAPPAHSEVQVWCNKYSRVLVYVSNIHGNNVYIVSHWASARACFARFDGRTDRWTTDKWR